MAPIFITSATHHEVTDKVDINHIQELLQDIDLSHYSDQVKQINFVYIAVTDTANHPESIAYDPEEQAINIYAQLDYEEVMTATPSEVLQMMKVLFLEWVERFEELGIEFNVVQFHNDINRLFGFKARKN